MADPGARGCATAQGPRNSIVGPRLLASAFLRDRQDADEEQENGGRVGDDRLGQSPWARHGEPQGGDEERECERLSDHARHDVAEPNRAGLPHHHAPDVRERVGRLHAMKWLRPVLSISLLLALINDPFDRGRSFDDGHPEPGLSRLRRLPPWRRPRTRLARPRVHHLHEPRSGSALHDLAPPVVERCEGLRRTGDRRRGHARRHRRRALATVHGAPRRPRLAGPARRRGHDLDACVDRPCRGRTIGSAITAGWRCSAPRCRRWRSTTTWAGTWTRSWTWGRASTRSSGTTR